MNLLEKIANNIKSGEITFLVGAGISYPKPSNLPLAGQVVSALLTAFYKRCSILQELYKNEIDFCNTLNTLRFESLLQILQENVEITPILNLVRNGVPNFFHFFLIECMKFKNFVITTNFDQLIEKAFQGRSLKVCSTDSEFRKAARQINSGKNFNFLFKIHGSIDKPLSIKATLNQVGSSGIGFANEKGKAEVFDKLVGEKELLILGYSGSDDFDIIPRLQYVKSNKIIYWLDYNPRTSFKIKKEKEIKLNKNWDLLTKNRKLVILSGKTHKFIEEISAKLLIKLPTPEEDNDQEKEQKYQKLSKHIDSFVNTWSNDFSGLIELITGLLLYNGNRRIEAQSCWEAALQLFQKRNDLSGVARSLTNLGVSYADQMKDNTALKFFTKSKKIYHKISDKQGLAYILRNKASIFARNGKWKKALELYEKSRRTYEQINNISSYALVTNTIAQIYTDLGRYEEATKLFKESNIILRDNGNLVGYSISLGNTGRLLFTQGYLEESEFIFKIALDILRKLGDMEGISKIQNNLGVLYGRQRRFDEAKEAFNEAENYASQIGDPTGEMDSKLNRGTLLLRQGELDKALSFLEEGIQLAKKLGVPDRCGQALGNIGLTLLDSGQVKDSIQYFMRSKKIFKKLGAEPEVAFTDENIGDVYIQLNEIKKGIKYYKSALKTYKTLGLDDQQNNILEKLKRHNSAAS